MSKRRLTATAALPVAASLSSSASLPIHSLDDGCLMHIFSFLAPIPDRYSIALVCHRWRYLACHPRLWLRIERSTKSLSEPGVFSNLEAAISAARPGDTILITPGGNHIACNIQIKKPLCLNNFSISLCWHCAYALTIGRACPEITIGGGELPDDTILTCSRGSESALEFLSTCKISNLTIRTELGCCLLHRSGRLIIEGCILQCEENPLDYLSFPIISTAHVCDALPQALGPGDSITVARTRIEGGAKAVWTSGNLVLHRVRAIYSRTSIFFWFEVGAH